MGLLRVIGFSQNHHTCSAWQLLQQVFHLNIQSFVQHIRESGTVTARAGRDKQSASKTQVPASTNIDYVQFWCHSCSEITQQILHHSLVGIFYWRTQRHFATPTPSGKISHQNHLQTCSKKCCAEII